MFNSDICDPETTMLDAYRNIRNMLLEDGLFHFDIDQEIDYFKIWREHMDTTPKNYDPIIFGSFQSSCIINLRDIERNLPELTKKYRELVYNREQNDTDPDYWECECPWDMLPIHATWAESYCQECHKTENEVADARKVDIAHIFSKEQRSFVFWQSRAVEKSMRDSSQSILARKSIAEALANTVMPDSEKVGGN